MKGIAPALLGVLIASLAITIIFIAAIWWLWPMTKRDQILLSERISTGISAINQFYMLEDHIKVHTPFAALSVAGELGRKGGCSNCSVWSRNEPKLNDLIESYRSVLSTELLLPNNVGLLGKFNVSYKDPKINISDLHVGILTGLPVLSMRDSYFFLNESSDKEFYFNVPLRYQMLLKIGRMLFEKGTKKVYPYIREDSVIDINNTSEYSTISASTYLDQPFVPKTDGYLTELDLGVKPYNIGNGPGIVLNVSIKDSSGKTLYFKNIYNKKIEYRKINKKLYLVLRPELVYVKSGEAYHIILSSLLPFQYSKLYSDNSLVFVTYVYPSSSIGPSTFTFSNSRLRAGSFRCSSVSGKTIYVNATNINIPTDNWFEYALLCGMTSEKYPVISQESYNESRWLVGAGGHYLGIAQSFRVNKDCELNTVEIYVNSTDVSCSDPLNITLIRGIPSGNYRYTVDPNNILGATSISSVSPHSWVKLSFPNGINLQSSKTYTFILERGCLTQLLINKSDESYSKGSLYIREWYSDYGYNWSRKNGDLVFRLYASGDVVTLPDLIQNYYKGVELSYEPIATEQKGNKLNVSISITDETTRVPKKGGTGPLELKFKTTFYRPKCGTNAGEICEGYDKAEIGNNINKICEGTTEYSCVFSGWSSPWIQENGGDCFCCRITGTCAIQNCESYCNSLGYSFGICAGSYDDVNQCEDSHTIRVNIYDTGMKYDCGSGETCFCYNTSDCEFTSPGLQCFNNQCPS